MGKNKAGISEGEGSEIGHTLASKVLYDKMIPR